MLGNQLISPYRLDHYAFRVKDRYKAAEFFINVMNYKVQAEFDICFDDGSRADCIALEPTINDIKPYNYYLENITNKGFCEYHLPPEIFISDGDEKSIVGKWVAKRGGVGGIHHIAMMVDSVKQTMAAWHKLGIEFETDLPLTCDGLVQIFTKPLELAGGIVYELIERKDHGFCRNNVKKLMLSTNGG